MAESTLKEEHKCLRTRNTVTIKLNRFKRENLWQSNKNFIYNLISSVNHCVTKITENEKF